MSKVVKRGYMINDEKEFSNIAVNEKFYKAGQDLYYLLNSGYFITGLI